MTTTDHPVSREYTQTGVCRGGAHDRCAGWHTAQEPYGPCECSCHQGEIDMTGYNRTGEAMTTTARPVSDEYAAEIAKRTKPGHGTWDYVDHGTRYIDALLADREWQAEQIADLRQKYNNLSNLAAEFDALGDLSEDT